jgi:hypothetical protein
MIEVILHEIIDSLFEQPEIFCRKNSPGFCGFWHDRLSLTELIHGIMGTACFQGSFTSEIFLMLIADIRA